MEFGQKTRIFLGFANGNLKAIVRRKANELGNRLTPIEHHQLLTLSHQSQEVA
jgi:hypothetical protein